MITANANTSTISINDKGQRKIRQIKNNNNDNMIMTKEISNSRSRLPCWKRGREVLGKNLKIVLLFLHTINNSKYFSI